MRLAKRLGIAQPDANLIRRGLKIPKPEICMKIAKLLDKNPVELLLIAQKDKAPSSAKQYWTLALTAVDVMLHVPKTPRYIPRKVEAIGRELRQLETQTLTYEGAEANAEAVRLVQTADRSIDAVMERWNIWKKGEALYPNYLLANQAAAKRGVIIRRLLVLTREQMQHETVVADAVQVMDDQHRAGINIFYAFREHLDRSPAFRRFEEDYRRKGPRPISTLRCLTAKSSSFLNHTARWNSAWSGHRPHNDDQPIGDYVEAGATQGFGSRSSLRYDAVCV